MPLGPGSRLGPYEILAPLGAGGMGEVWRARDTKLSRDVALKVLPAHLQNDPKSLARFEREARAVAALSHPNIVAIHDFGRIDEVSFAVEELLEGETLRALLARGPVPLPRALGIARQVADALAAAHARGIVHRDVKPENVFLTRDGHAKLLDFGLARVTDPADSGTDDRSPTAALTDADVLLGTVSYMSPEQARGLTVDHRSDQFSLGVTLYELIAGRRPFSGTSRADTLAAILREDPPSLVAAAPLVPPHVRRLVERCLAKDPAERWDSTRDLARDLAEAFSSAERREDGKLRPPRLNVPRPWLRAALLLATGAAAGVLASRATRTERPAALPRPFFTRVRTLASALPRPSLSPDGKTILFEAEKAPGDVDVFALRVGGLNPIDLTADSTGYDGQARFSPDGVRIAFRSDRDGGGIFVMGATGETPRRVTDHGHEPSWFPDGKRIAFSTTWVGSPNARFGFGGLETVDLASGQIRTLVDRDREDAVQPSVSPHGLRIAFWRQTLAGLGTAILSMPADGPSPAGTATTAVDGPGDRLFAPSWSPDGRFLYYGCARDGTQNLWRVAIDERTGVVSGEPEAIGLVATSSWNYGLSADGRRLVFSANLGSGSLERYPFDSRTCRISGRPTLVLAEPVGCSGGISPDGHRLVYWTGLAARNDIWSVGTDGRDVRKLTDDGLVNRWPHFSADGRRVFFQSTRAGGVRVWSVGIDGRGLEESLLHPSFALRQPIPSPDGRSIAVYSSIEGPFVVPLPHAASSPLPPSLPHLDEKTFFWPWSWSPDAKKLAGNPASKAEGRARTGIRVCDLATRTYEEVRSTGLEPRFLPDARHLVFKDGNQLLVRDLASREEHVILEFPPGTDGSVAAVAPDGRSLYVLTATERSEIWLAEYPAPGR